VGVSDVETMRRVRLFELVRSSSPICFGSLQTTTPDFRFPSTEYVITPERLNRKEENLFID
ncbi:hypothetical protein J6590_098031, partial [Homalodisca vitripennis]